MPTKRSPSRSPYEWQLRFYIAGHTAAATAGLETILRLCEERVPGRFSIEVIDVSVDPSRAASDQILLLPCLVRRVPEARKIMVGYPRDLERLALQLALPKSTECGEPYGLNGDGGQ